MPSKIKKGETEEQREREGAMLTEVPWTAVPPTRVSSEEKRVERAHWHAREEREKESTLDSGQMLMPIDTNTPSSTSEEVAYSKYTEVVPTRRLHGSEINDRNEWVHAERMKNVKTISIIVRTVLKRLNIREPYY
jgi:hypothetical protein